MLPKTWHRQVLVRPARRFSPHLPCEFNPHRDIERIKSGSKGHDW